MTLLRIPNTYYLSIYSLNSKPSLFSRRNRLKFNIMGFKTLNEVDVADGTVQLITCKSAEAYMAGSFITFKPPFRGSYLTYIHLSLFKIVQKPSDRIQRIKGTNI